MPQFDLIRAPTCLLPQAAYASFALSLLRMCPLFHSREPETPPSIALVPTVFPTIAGAEIAAVFVGKRVAGDFYDSIRVGPERVLIGLLDVGGRRENNRSILATAQRIFRQAGTEIFAPADLNESDALTELNLRINRELLESEKGVRSCPAFIACYHEKFGTLCYTNAGHTPGLLRDHTGIAELAHTGLPLGLFSHATSDAPTVGMENGSCLLLVSRGVVECGARSSGDGKIGLQRIKDLLQKTALTSAQDLCTSILSPLPESGGNAPLCDDRTALALLRTA